MVDGDEIHRVRVGVEHDRLAMLLVSEDLVVNTIVTIGSLCRTTVSSSAQQCAEPAVTADAYDREVARELRADRQGQAPSNPPCRGV